MTRRNIHTTPWNDELIEKLRLSAKTMNVYELIKLFDMTISQIRNKCHRENIKIKRAPYPKDCDRTNRFEGKRLEELKSKAVTMTISELVVYFDSKYGKIRRACDRYGIRPKGSKPRIDSIYLASIHKDDLVCKPWV